MESVHAQNLLQLNHAMVNQRSSTKDPMASTDSSRLAGGRQTIVMGQSSRSQDGYSSISGSPTLEDRLARQYSPGSPGSPGMETLQPRQSPEATADKDPSGLGTAFRGRSLRPAPGSGNAM